MELLHRSRSEWRDYLVTVAIVLGVLLVVLVAWALLGNLIGLFGRFQR